MRLHDAQIVILIVAFPLLLRPLLFDHLEGEAQEEVKYCPPAEREDPDKTLAVLQELHGCLESYAASQQAFLLRWQQAGATLQEFLLALMGLMEAVKQQAPTVMQNADVVVQHTGGCSPSQLKTAGAMASDRYFS